MKFESSIKRLEETITLLRHDLDLAQERIVKAKSEIHEVNLQIDSCNEEIEYLKAADSTSPTP